MRLIDADALRARMYHESFETDSDMQRWDSGCWIRYKLFEKCLNEQPSAPQWIPVSEELPRDARAVLISDRFRTVIFGYVDFEGNWYLGDDERKADPGEVIAWMPLPEAYEEK